jgi:hypothetical protein
MVEFVQQFSDIYPVEKLVKKGNCCANGPNKKIVAWWCRGYRDKRKEQGIQKNHRRRRKMKK